MPDVVVTTRPVFTAVDVCNLALTQLGEDRITSVQSPDSEIAQFCHDVYETTVCSELAKFEWGFAKGYRSLSPLVSPALEEWSYTYQLPNDCLVVRRTSLTEDRWEVIDDKIGYDGTPLKLFYTRRAPEAHWPAYFLDAIALVLASRLAMAIQHDQNAAVLFTKRGDSAMADARVHDYQANPARRINGDAGVFAIRSGQYSARTPLRYR